MFSISQAQVIGHSAARGLTAEPSVRVSCVVMQTKGKAAGKNTLGALQFNGAAQTETNLNKKEVFLVIYQNRVFIAEYNDAIPSIKGTDTQGVSGKGKLASGSYAKEVARAMGFAPTEEKRSFSIGINTTPIVTPEGVRLFELSNNVTEVEEVEETEEEGDDAVTPEVTPTVEAPVSAPVVNQADNEALPEFPVQDEDDSL